MRLPVVGTFHCYSMSSLALILTLAVCVVGSGTKGRTLKFPQNPNFIFASKGPSYWILTISMDIFSLDAWSQRCMRDADTIFSLCKIACSEINRGTWCKTHVRRLDFSPINSTFTFFPFNLVIFERMS